MRKPAGYSQWCICAKCTKYREKVGHKPLEGSNQCTCGEWFMSRGQLFLHTGNPSLTPDDLYTMERTINA